MWQTKNGKLYREFEFKDFKEAFGFMEKVAAEAERQHHHPRWQNQYNRLQIWLSTHDSGRVTAKDKALAAAIDEIFETGNSDNVADKKTTAITDVKVYADGGSRGNPGPSASGFAVLDMDDKVLEKHGVYLGETTNNQAEYEALRLGLEAAQKLGARHVDVYMDSELVVKQMLGAYKVRKPELVPVHQAIKSRVAQFEQVTFTHVPREFNKLADRMVNETLDTELTK